MYVWVILATFLAMLASYTLAPRSDMREVTVEPLAQAELGKFAAQHRAGYDYVRLHKPPYTGSKKYNNYSPGVISESTLRSYLPFGYVLSGLYTTQIFCMNEDMTQELGGGTNGPCNEEGGHKVMVTYGPIPERWVNLSVTPEQPNTDFMNAVRSMAYTGEVVGFTMYDPDAEYDDNYNMSDSKIRVFDGRGLYDSFVPVAVLNNATYKKVCDMDDDLVCLVSVTAI